MEAIKGLSLKVIYILVVIYLIVFIPVIWNYYPLIIVSGSMEPTLKVGGILYYHEKEIKNFKNGEILVFKTKKHIVSHRIVKINNTNFITKGDANKNNDSKYVKHNQIIGQGTNYSIPFVGYYVDYIYHHKYLLLILSSILIIDIYRKERIIKNE